MLAEGRADARGRGRGATTAVRGGGTARRRALAGRHHGELTLILTLPHRAAESLNWGTCRSVAGPPRTRQALSTDSPSQSAADGLAHSERSSRRWRRGSRTANRWLVCWAIRPCSRARFAPPRTWPRRVWSEKPDLPAPSNSSRWEPLEGW